MLPVHVTTNKKNKLNHVLHESKRYCVAFMYRSELIPFFIVVSGKKSWKFLKERVTQLLCEFHEKLTCKHPYV